MRALYKAMQNASAEGESPMSVIQPYYDSLAAK
jgi:hypothetical protein